MQPHTPAHTGHPQLRPHHLLAVPLSTQLSEGLESTLHPSVRQHLLKLPHAACVSLVSPDAVAPRCVPHTPVFRMLLFSPKNTPSFPRTPAPSQARPPGCVKTLVCAANPVVTDHVPQPLSNIRGVFKRAKSSAMSASFEDTKDPRAPTALGSRGRSLRAGAEPGRPLPPGAPGGLVAAPLPAARTAHLR